ncbi:lytic murein transglycosylase [Shewanella sp. SNU WT4]|uniref:lytic murein transglycosylase n=1 Tax=Shewanella sp. SNU WT4 TaxID=2590015 RepID=UPI001F0F32A0|nr:lytic murein transglycosylase [Shewanella sp. SNU WT4]
MLKRRISILLLAGSGMSACASSALAPSVPVPNSINEPIIKQQTVKQSVEPTIAQIVEQSKANFPECVTKLQQQAQAQGINAAIIKASLADAQFVTKVIELDRAQPEFSQTFADYYTKRVTDKRIEQGRALYKEHQVLLNKLAAEYGVPPQYLLAFWGLETNFGGYKGKMPVIDSLATLACEPRRSTYFTQELMQALRIQQIHGIDKQEMVGSWAGAMGHTQFMPSAYLNHAKDGDGDGKINLWQSTDDALTSAAAFLQALGWQRGEPWGQEVKLPANFDYALLGAKHSRDVALWADLGVTQANGQVLSRESMPAAVYLPAGYQGPAFLAYPNFEVIQKWNRSIFYAIAVGQLADSINGGGPLVVQPPEQAKLTRAQLQAMQQKLTDLGYDVGKPDGVFGPRSKAALQAFQLKAGLIADGYPHDTSFKALGL